MKSIKLEYIVYVIVMVTTLWLPLATGCSPPEGGLPDPTPEGSVHYATHVVVGKVTAIVRPDVMFPEYGSTYTAKVTVQCTYKGPVLTGNILVGGAGYIPGHCTTKDLEVATGKKYVILFLNEKRDVNGQNVYDQSEKADLGKNITNYLDICGLKMNYPEENGITMRRESCREPKNTGICKSYNSRTGQVEVNTAPTPTVTQGPGQPIPIAPGKPIPISPGQPTTPVSTGPTPESAAVKDGDGNGSSGLFVSVLTSFLFAFISLAL